MNLGAILVPTMWVFLQQHKDVCVCSNLMYILHNI